MAEIRRQVVLHPDEDGGYWVDVPSLPGCVSQGDTKEEALQNIKEAIEAYIESLQAHHEPNGISKLKTITFSIQLNLE